MKIVTTQEMCTKFYYGFECVRNGSEDVVPSVEFYVFDNFPSVSQINYVAVEKFEDGRVKYMGWFSVWAKIRESVKNEPWFSGYPFAQGGPAVVADWYPYFRIFEQSKQSGPSIMALAVSHCARLSANVAVNLKYEDLPRVARNGLVDDGGVAPAASGVYRVQREWFPKRAKRARDELPVGPCEQEDCAHRCKKEHTESV